MGNRFGLALISGVNIVFGLLFCLALLYGFFFDDFVRLFLKFDLFSFLLLAMSYFVVISTINWFFVFYKQFKGG